MMAPTTTLARPTTTACPSCTTKWCAAVAFYALRVVVICRCVSQDCFKLDAGGGSTDLTAVFNKMYEGYDGPGCTNC